MSYSAITEETDSLEMVEHETDIFDTFTPDPLTKTRHTLHRKERSATFDFDMRDLPSAYDIPECETEFIKSSPLLSTRQARFSKVSISWPKPKGFMSSTKLKESIMSPEKFKRLMSEKNMDTVLREECMRELRVPRDAKTERRCQCLSIVVAVAGLLVVFAMAITYPYAADVPVDRSEVYLTECPLSDIIPVYGTVACSSNRSRTTTEVSCLVTCTNGIEERDKKLVNMTSDYSFQVTCSKEEKWPLLKGVNDLCQGPM